MQFSCRWSWICGNLLHIVTDIKAKRCKLVEFVVVNLLLRLRGVQEFGQRISCIVKCTKCSQMKHACIPWRLPSFCQIWMFYGCRQYLHSQICYWLAVTTVGTPAARCRHLEKPWPHPHNKVKQLSAIKTRVHHSHVHCYCACSVSPGVGNCLPCDGRAHLCTPTCAMDQRDTILWATLNFVS